MTDIRDVAKSAGVSPGTVSRVLNGKARGQVSAETCRRVLHAAERLDYHPSSAAQALVRGRTRTVGLYSSRTLFTAVFARSVDIIQHITQKYDYHLLFLHPDDPSDLAGALKGARIDALLWCRYPIEEADELADSAAPHQAIIGIASMHTQPPSRICGAYWEQERGVRLMVDHLADLGHQRIAFLAGAHVEHPYVGDMLDMFEDACGRRHVNAVTVTTGDEDDNLAAGADMGKRLLTYQKIPSAVFARNDEFAIAAMSTAIHAGLNIPGDIAIGGYNDLPFAEYCTPSLTSVHIPRTEAYRSVLPSILEAVRRDDNAAECLTQMMRMESELMIRSSTTA